MLKEIEKKYRVENLDEIEKKLRSVGATLQKEIYERDIYFNVSGRDSMTTKECLRIRVSPAKKEITYKPPTVHEETLTHFAKQETNLSVEDTETARDLLLCLGNSLLVDFTKHRKYYGFDGTTVTLDTLNNKFFFVEIEVESASEENALKQIHAIESMLGLSDEFIETRPYRDIAMMEQQ